ncbi:MAG: hypothetical protein SGPRY_012407 [Prymnesium sp.]
MEARLLDRSEVEAVRDELTAQMGVVAKQQAQLEALMAETRQEKRSAQQALTHSLAPLTIAGDSRP